jgi:hypothetical protein
MPNTMMRIAVTFLFGTLMPLWAVGADLMFPVPKNANAPTHIVLQPSVVEEDYFWVTEKYPASSTLDYYGHVLAKWRKCTGPEKEWNSFGDLANSEPQFIHQRARYWVSAKNDAAIIVMIKYHSKGSAWRDKPDNDKQFVAVVKYTQPEARKMLDSLKVSCNVGI